MAGFAQQAITLTPYYGSVGTTATSIVPARSDNGRNLVLIQNTHASQSLGVTLDGTTPVIGANALTLAAGASLQLDKAVPQGAIELIGSGASTTYMIYIG
ncbi:MAG: hypothetical protein KGL39_17905 [Patescibacteria group bacterium]|nr:hypothetical protein [Patescibacteria group bacterium]